MYQNILLATDLTESGKEAANKARELANQCGATLFAIHVVAPIPAYGYPGVTDIESPYIDEAKEELNKLCEKYSIPEKNRYLKVGSTKRVVMELAEKLNIDLIIVGSHSKSAFTKLLGSTANAILHTAPCDVVTIRIK